MTVVQGIVVAEGSCSLKFITDPVNMTLGRVCDVSELLLLVNVLQGVLDHVEAVLDDGLRVPDAGLGDLPALVGDLSPQHTQAAVGSAGHI